jgi:hypothetical protein
MLEHNDLPGYYPDGGFFVYDPVSKRRDVRTLADSIESYERFDLEETIVRHLIYGLP